MCLKLEQSLPFSAMACNHCGSNPQAHNCTSDAVTIPHSFHIRLLCLAADAGYINTMIS